MQSESANSDAAAQQLARMEGYLAQDPANPHLLVDIIDLCLRLGRMDAARRHVDAARALLPDDDLLLQRESNVLIAEGNLLSALALCERLHDRNADAALAYNLAYVQFLLEQYALAQATLQPYLSQPDASLASVNLMLRCLHHQGRVQEALEVVARHRPVYGADQEFLSIASLLYLDGGEMELAQQASAAVLGAAAGSVAAAPLEALVVGAAAALGHGDLATASRYYQTALRRKPDDGRSWSGIGLISLLERDLPLAASQLEQAIQYLPQHIGTRHILGWCKILAHDLVGAEAVFRAALALDRNFGETHGALAVVAAMRGERAEAETGIRRAMGLNPDGLAARYAQMLLSGSVDDPAKFKEEATAVLASHAGPFGGTMADMLVKFTR